MSDTMHSGQARRVLWWGRFDPDYSRNRILRQAFGALGWDSTDFQPRLSAVGDLEARLRRLPPADLVFVPCFRQRDIAAARRYSHARHLPLMVDPLISAYDKQVYERAKLTETSRAARRLRDWEGRLLRSADAVLADTAEHARFFREALSVPAERLHVVHVGAEEALFKPAPPRPPNSPIEALFYGSFIPLQGPQVIVEAARRYQGPPVRWILLGNGPLLAECRQRAAGLTNVEFEDWLPYAELPARIHRADILLGIFGTTPKATRVIPNKLYQALACGKPVVTLASDAYPAALRAADGSGLTWVGAGDAAELARAVADLAGQPALLRHAGEQARVSYERHFSRERVVAELGEALGQVIEGGPLV